MSTTIKDVEDGIVATLIDWDDLSYVKKIEPIQTLDVEELKKAFAFFPSIGVIGTDGAYSDSLNVQDETGTFVILCVNRNERSNVAPLRGGAGEEKGVWDMLDDCRAALRSGVLKDVDVLDCTAKRRRLLYAMNGFAVCALEVEVIWRHQ